MPDHQTMKHKAFPNSGINRVETAAIATYERLVCRNYVNISKHLFL